MGFFSNLVNGAKTVGGNILHSVEDTPFIPTPDFSGGRLRNTPVSLHDIGRNLAPATTTAIQPIIKSSTDLVGTVGGYLPKVGSSIKTRQAEADTNLEDWAHQAHQQLGISDHDTSVQIAKLIPKVTGTLASLDSGVKEAQVGANIASSLTRAGLGAKSISLLNDVADHSPELGRALTNYILHPETDINLFKSTFNVARASAGKLPGVTQVPLRTGAAVKVAKAAGSAIGGAVGFNAIAGPGTGKSLSETAKDTAKGIPGNFAGEHVMEGASIVAPKALAFLKQAIPEAQGAVKTRLSEIADHLLPTVDAYHDPMMPSPTHGEAPAPHVDKIAELEHLLTNHPAADTLEVSKARQVASKLGATNDQYQQILAGRLQQLDHQANFKDTANKVALETKPAASNAKLAEAQHIATQKVSQVSPDGTKGGGFKPLDAYMQKRFTQLKTMAANRTEERYGSSRPTSNELAQTDKRAAELEAGLKTKPQDVVPSAAAPTTIPSSVQNVAGTTGQDIVHNEANGRPIVHREYDDKGNVTRVVNTQHGEVFEKSSNGSPLGQVKNELLRENKDQVYGKTGQDIANVHGVYHGTGMAETARIRIAQATEHLDKSLNGTERDQLRNYMEGRLGDGEVSSKVREIGQQWRELERLGYLGNKEAKSGTGEIEAPGKLHLKHINLDQPVGKQEEIPVGKGKFSTKNGSQLQRSRIKFISDKAGVDPRFGTIKEAKLEEIGNNKFQDKQGNIYHATQASIDELNGHGFHYESDPVKIFAHSMNEYAKTINNNKLVRQLTQNVAHSDAVINRRPGELVPPKGFKESDLPGMEGKWISKDYHSRLYTSTDTSEGNIYKAAKLGGKAVNLATTPLVKAFFTISPHFHAVFNEGTQALVSSGIGTKTGVGGMAKTASNITWATHQLQTHSQEYIDHIAAGMNSSHPSSGGIDKPVQNVLKRVAGWVSHNPSLRLGEKMTEVISVTSRMANAKRLVDEGMTLQEAHAAINKIQGDYNNLGKFEKDILKNYVAFYPFFKHTVVSNVTTVGQTVKSLSQGKLGTFGGTAVTAAMVYATTKALEHALRQVTGNDYASIRPGGSLSLVDDLGKIKGQVSGYTDKQGNKQPGKVPTALTNRIPSGLREPIEQVAGKGVLSDGKPIDKSIAGRLEHASNTASPLQVTNNLNSGKKSVGEVALNLNNVKLPHGISTLAAPKLTGPLGDAVNVSGHDSQKTVANAQALKDAGGSKLIGMQIARAQGDKSLSKFFGQNPQLDPTSSQFTGYNFRNTEQEKTQVAAGANAAKTDGQKLTYMQMMQLSGSDSYQKFFSQHPELDPTSNKFQGYQSQKSAAKRQQSYALSTIKRSNHIKTSVKGTPRATGIKVKSLRTKVAIKTVAPKKLKIKA